MNQTLKRYLVSSGITFVTAFLIAVGAQLSTMHITPETLGWSLALSIGAAAFRTAIKAVLEGFCDVTGDSQ